MSRKKPKSKVVRVSETVLDEANRLKKGKETLDSILRRVLGLPTRKGIPQHLLELWLVPSSGFVHTDKAKAKGEAVKQAVKKGRLHPEKLIRLREVL